MKYAEMREVFAEELSFLEMLTEYEHGLERIDNVGEAQTEIEGWQADGYDEFPSSFLRKEGPQTVMMLWNTFIVPDEKTKKAIEDEEYFDRFRAEHPDWLCFDYYYADGNPLFIDPESLAWTLRTQHHYDIAHCELIVKALKAYHQNYQENL